MKALHPTQFAELTQMLSDELAPETVERDELASLDELADAGLIHTFVESWEDEEGEWESECWELTDRGRLAVRVHVAYLASLA